MASKAIVSGKHPLVVRITESDYERLRYLAAKSNTTVNMILAKAAEDIARDIELPPDFKSQ